jgi:hypothetical protein
MIMGRLFALVVLPFANQIQKKRRSWLDHQNEIQYVTLPIQTSERTTGGMLIRRSLCFVLCVSLLATAANAGSLTLYDNLGQTTAGTLGVAASFGGPPADSFSTGATSVFLADVQLLVRVEYFGSNPPGPPGSFNVSLLSDKMTNPGTVLTKIGTVNDESILNEFGGAPGVINLPVASFSLAANTRYWIELSDANPNMPTVSFWAFAPGNGGTGVAGEFFFFDGLVFPNTEGPFQMKVTASTSAVPEPSTAILAGIGAVGFIAYGWSRHRRAQRQAAA